MHLERDQLGTWVGKQSFCNFIYIYIIWYIYVCVCIILTYLNFTIKKLNLGGYTVFCNFTHTKKIKIRCENNL